MDWHYDLSFEGCVWSCVDDWEIETECEMVWRDDVGFEGCG